MARIAIFIPDMRGGGAERVVLTLAQGFVERGNEVDLVLLRSEGELIELLPAKVRIVDLKAFRMRHALRPLVKYLKRERPDALLAVMWPLTAMALLARKVARKRVAATEPTPSATTHLPVPDLRNMLGVSPYDPDEMTLDDRIGVASGLAYTTVGGEILEIEVSVVAGRGRLHLTGTLGDVMKESASAALSYVRGRARTLGLDPEFLRTRDLHIHIPAGATPKDGPSAGIAIATAVISALTGTPVRGDTAMTGEITLRGRVLGIGGLREKSVAAHRGRIRHVVIPKANARELEELPEDVRAGLTFHPVATMDEVLALAFRARPRPAEPVAEVTQPTAVLAH